MRDDPQPAMPPAKPSLIDRLSRRVDSNKLSLPLALGFFAALALMCAAAAAVGFLIPHVKH